MVVTTVIATKSDPTDPTLSLERAHYQSKSKQKEGEAQVIFDPSQFSFFCNICNSHVLRNSKHCQRCNRCACEFDHHCLWINNDIGILNYSAFLRMLIAVILAMSLQTGQAIYSLTFSSDNCRDGEESCGFIGKDDFRVVACVQLAISVCLFVLTGYLLSYHALLIRKNTTTYR